MTTKLRKCQKCGRYTMMDACPDCGSKTKTAHPSKYSPEDKYASYRRRLKFGDGCYEKDAHSSEKG